MGMWSSWRKKEESFGEKALSLSPPNIGQVNPGKWDRLESDIPQFVAGYWKWWHSL